MTRMHVYVLFKGGISNMHTRSCEDEQRHGKMEMER